MSRRAGISSRSGPAIGLFGGSFNPAHAGHRHVADAGLRELQLDQVWWLVSPQNPLKPAQPSPYDRAKSIASMELPYAMKISHVESDLNTRYTIDLIKRLQEQQPFARFVLLMGSDNLAQLPRWKDWQGIIRRVPVAIIARPGDPVRARLGRVARHMADHRIPESFAHTLKDTSAPAWTYLTLPFNSLSSSALRAAER